MAEQDKIINNYIKYNGIYSFSDFYKFCHDWLEEEEGLDIAEVKYSEKLIGSLKNIEIEWECTKKLTDYFQIKIKLTFELTGLKEVEIQQGGAKVKANQGEVKLKTQGFLVKDYDSKFEKDAWRKFLRSIYEKWIIPSRVEQFEDKVFKTCDDFLAQAKAYLALEGKR